MYWANVVLPTEEVIKTSVGMTKLGLKTHLQWGIRHNSIGVEWFSPRGRRLGKCRTRITHIKI